MNKRECALCRENKGVKHFASCHGNKAYVAQQAWNCKMHRLLAADGVIPVFPAPDYSLKALEAWTVTQSVTVVSEPGHPSITKVVPNMWWRQMHALLAKEPKPYRPTMPTGEVT